MALRLPRCGEPTTRGKPIALTAAGIAALLLLWPWLVILTNVAFTYLYWLNPEVHWALPDAVKQGEGKADLPVPKVIHQTWKTRDVPDKWRAARDSCIQLHPDYEHKLWTDAEGLQFIEVRGARARGCGGARQERAARSRPTRRPTDARRSTTPGSCPPTCPTPTTFSE